MGAGNGGIASLVQRTGSCEVYALEPNNRRITFIQNNHPNLKVCKSTAESIPYEDAFFDKVYCTMAFHHFRDQKKSIEEFGRVLKPGGVLVVVEISPHTLFGRLARFFDNSILRSSFSFLDAEDLAALLRREGKFGIEDAIKKSYVYFVKAVRTAK